MNDQVNVKSLPFQHRMLRQIGINVPRPEHAPFMLNVLLFGTPFGLIWSSFMVLTNQYIFVMVPFSWSFVPYGILAGLSFGICMAVMSRRKAE